jgi:lysine-specific demethylase 3
LFIFVLLLRIAEARDALIAAGCDLATVHSSGDPERLPGAVWHIWEAKDAPAIRNLLHRIAQEKREKYSVDSDPIHDQQTYLDDQLRGRLYREYGITGYEFVQCLGDAVFIPAGAPHQVSPLGFNFSKE